MVGEVSRRRRRGDDVRREPHDAAPVAALEPRRRAGAGHARARRGARVGAQARSEPSRRESLLHSRRRGVAQSRARDPERDAPHDVDAGRRAPRAHAGAHLLADRRLRSRRGNERQRVGGGPRVHRAHRRDGRLSADVLDAQHSLHRVRARAAGPLRRGEAGGRRDGRQRRRRRPRDADARRLPPVSADGRSALPPLGHVARDAGARDATARSATRSGATRARWRSRRRARRATRRPSSAASSASGPPCRPKVSTSSTTKPATCWRWPPRRSTRSSRPRAATAQPRSPRGAAP